MQTLLKNVPNTLPALDATAKIHGEKVVNYIAGKISRQGPLSFADYMNMALYAPGLGYYSAGAHKLGQDGDFITAPEISSLFSRALARQCGEVLANLSYGVILEFGAGSGVMAKDILFELEKMHCLPEQYLILEVSADLRWRQQKYLKQHAARFYEKIKWLDRLPDQPIQGVVIANEVLDAMPVHKFMIDDKIQEFYVDYQQEQFSWHIDKPSTNELARAIAALAIDFAKGYESEINLLLPGWIASLNAILERGVVLLIDYGFPCHEYYHHDRHMGTVMCHYRHHAHANPLILPGLQDITAHVDFTAVAQAAVANQFDVVGFTHQAALLINLGIAEMMPSNATIEEQYVYAQAIKRLTLPSEMGELFKAIALAKNYHQPLLGFSSMDQCERL